MRRLVIPTLFTLTLLCAPISTPQGRGLNPIRWTPPITDSLQAGAQSVQESVALEPGKPIERELSGGQSHSYKITLISGQYLHIVVDQRGVDVAVALFTPDDKKLGEVDTERLALGPETISAIAESAGAYRIEARSTDKTAQPGRYEIRIEELREATAEDGYRVAGEAAFREAERLKDGTLEAKRKSVEKYHEAMGLFRKAGARKWEAKSLSNVGEVYWLLGETQKALEKFNEVLPIRRETGDPNGEAEALNNIGVVYWSVGDLQKALEKFNEALPIRHAVGDYNGEAETIHNIGLIYYSLGDMQKALEHYNKSLPIRQKVGDYKGAAITLSTIGLVYWSLGDMQKALEYYSKSLPIRQKAGDQRGAAITLNNIGLAYWSLGDMQKALDKYNEALPISRAVGNRNGEVYTLEGLGAVYRSLGEMGKSLDNFNEALQICRAIKDRNSEATALSNIGLVYSLLGDMRKALDKYNEALPIVQAIGNRRLEASVLINIGEAHCSLGETQMAMEKLNEALLIVQAVGDRNGEAATLLNIARTEQKRGSLTLARQTIEQAISIIESVRSDIVSQELRASFFGSRREFYECYIDILMQMHTQNPAASFDTLALAISERGRARSLLELLTEARADIRQGVDASLLERERHLQQRLAAKAAAQTTLLNSKHTQEQAGAIAKEIASITAEYEELEGQIRASSPRYAALTHPQPLNLSDIQQQALDPETLLLEYSLGENSSYLFVVSQTSITWSQLPKRAEIEEAARQVRELLTAPQPRSGDTEAKYRARVKEAEERYWTQAAALSRMLLGPVASQLGGKRLVIVADGALQYIPFGALPALSPRNGEGRNTGAESQPLFVEHEIVNLPSASTLVTLRRETAGRKPAEKSIAVLADPVFADDDTRVRRNVGKAVDKEKTGSVDSDETEVASRQMLRSGKETGVIGAEGGFGRLLSTRREAAAISALVPARDRMQALDFEANRKTALMPELGEYRIIHFATHGMLNNIHPELSGLVLSLVDESGKQQDGFLRLQDIYNMKLSAELVTLSACQTGLGKEIKGEGLIGLTRGFMYAGAPRIVESLWKVDDLATSELMKRFYQGMLGPEALSAAGALRQAQLSIWKQKQWKAPYYWAAFVLQGEWK